MRPLAVFFALFAAIGAALASGLAARQAVIWIETRTGEDLAAALAGQDWAHHSIDGLTIHLRGTAPDERTRFQVLEAVSRHVAGHRIADETTVATDAPPPRPEFALEILRSGSEISLLGLVPEATGRDDLMQRFGRAVPDGAVTEMLEVVGAAPPVLWDETLSFAELAVRDLAQARISVRPGAVTATAVVSRAQDRDAVETALRAALPDGIALSLAIDAPLQIISPFRFALTLSGDRAALVACAAATPQGRDLILAALPASITAPACDLGLGAPSPDWSRAVATGIDALVAMGSGVLEVEGADVILTAPDGYDADAFDAVTLGLQDKLPPPYTLRATLPPAPDLASDAAAAAPIVFAARRGSDGAVRMRGDLKDITMQRTAATFAKAKFGFDAVIDQTRVRADLPSQWHTRVLAGLEALSYLTSGEVEVTEDRIAVTGEVTNARVRTEISNSMRPKLPPATELSLDLTISSRVVRPKVSAARSEFCALQIETILAMAQITFPPGETAISDDSVPVVEAIAQVLRDCPGARFEIAGHTDSQGREDTNLGLSQARAASVLDALHGREGVQVFLVARGYGEAEPIADNATENGRALNRRIEFRLVAEEDQSGADDAEGDAVATAPHDAAHDHGQDAPDAAALMEQAAPADDATDADAASANVSDMNEPDAPFENADGPPADPIPQTIAEPEGTAPPATENAPADRDFVEEGDTSRDGTPWNDATVGPPRAAAPNVSTKTPRDVPIPASPPGHDPAGTGQEDTGQALSGDTTSRPDPTGDAASTTEEPEAGAVAEGALQTSPPPMTRSKAAELSSEDN